MNWTLQHKLCSQSILKCKVTEMSYPFCQMWNFGQSCNFGISILLYHLERLEFRTARWLSRSWIRACNSSPNHCCNLISYIALWSDDGIVKYWICNFVFVDWMTFAGWPKGHKFRFYKFIILDIFLIDYYGGAVPLTVDEYYKSSKQTLHTL